MRRSSGWIDRPPEALPGDERMEAPSEAVHLDDVTGPYAFEPHRRLEEYGGWCFRSRSWTVRWTVLSADERF
jgi:hypothetical protein